ncbi:unnamed protein product [Rotaria sp. Silwood1]|nr:unnamed protein product [Rotaria sp. Silwood1]CAF3385155.1 unnamed protein product [Rotaria sp. Silwood1]CAF3396840.1 unnamed protein product [Rotaria sp. Silwood1]CAF4538431.1 unnamed protein product [Rotaria sp. Silwood1]CAF4762309.1 unnamed protein product [Rotaria sp. Silwood1]
MVTNAIIKFFHGYDFPTRGNRYICPCGYDFSTLEERKHYVNILHQAVMDLSDEEDDKEHDDPQPTTISTNPFNINRQFRTTTDDENYSLLSTSRMEKIFH